MRKLQHSCYSVITVMTLFVFAACRKDATVSKPVAAAPDASTNNGMVLTPVGYMAKEHVHFIAPGFHLNVANGRLQKVETQSGKLIEDFGEVKPLESQYNPARQALSGNVPSGRVPYTQGWIAYTYWNNTGSPITNFTTNWVVPSAPSKKSSQTIFLFNGMQDGTTSTSYIIQPVLQWGPSAAGGGKYWAITNWYVSASSAFFGSLVTVSTGASLTGILKQTAVSGSNYSYNSSFAGYSSASALQINNVPQAFWAAETLESYGVATPSNEYPPNSFVGMNSIVMQQGSTYAPLSWTAVQATAGAAQKAVVVSNSSSNGAVDIYFR